MSTCDCRMDVWINFGDENGSFSLNIAFIRFGQFISNEGHENICEYHDVIVLFLFAHSNTTFELEKFRC